MNSVPIHVGIDYHPGDLQLCVMDVHGRQLRNCTCANDAQAIERLVSPLGKVVGVAMEACSGSADLAEELIARCGWNVSLGHATYIAKMKGSPDKSDWSDGRLIADLSRVGYVPLVWMPPAYIRDLRLLVNYRQQLVAARKNLKLRVGAVLREQRVKIPSELSRWSKGWIACVRQGDELTSNARWIVNDHLDELEVKNRQIARAELQLRKATRNDAVVKRLLAQDGIGEVTAWVMRAFIGDFSRFRRGKQLARYCGLTPCNASSGNKQADAGLVHGCNRLLRSIIVQAAQRLIRTVPRWSHFAGGMRKRGKHHNVIVGAVGNRWLRVMHHVMKETASAATVPPERKSRKTV